MTFAERRRGRTIAIIGVDGSGKTTIARRLAEELGDRATYVYMGTNPDAAQDVLPLTRLVRAVRRRTGAAPGRQGGPPRPKSAAPSGLRGVVRRMRSAAYVANLIAEELYRQARARRAELRGRTVIFDRHFYFDYYTHVVIEQDRPRSSMERLHGWILRRLPQPSPVILLDAPAEAVYARKAEGRLEDVRRRRDEYLSIADRFPAIQRVDADRPLDEVYAEVRRIVVAAIGDPADG